jgi:hypothetical protein
VNCDQFYECYRLICPGETYQQTAGCTVLCPDCADKGAEVLR